MLFGPKILEEVNSKYSGKIKVVATFGYKYIATGILTQSGGLVRDVWEPVIKKLKTQNSKPKTVLILGLAGGTIAQLMAKRFPGAKITGVEIDPIMIDLGKKYLGLDHIPNLEIIVGDAKKYVNNGTIKQFDFILVDMYLGDQFPSFVYSLRFLKKLKLLGRCIVFNHLFYDDRKREKAHKLVEGLKTIFPNVKLVRKLTNLLIICEA